MNVQPSTHSKTKNLLIYLRLALRAKFDASAKHKGAKCPGDSKASCCETVCINPLSHSKEVSFTILSSELSPLSALDNQLASAYKQVSLKAIEVANGTPLAAFEAAHLSTTRSRSRFASAYSALGSNSSRITEGRKADEKNLQSPLWDMLERGLSKNMNDPYHRVGPCVSPGRPS